MNDSTPSDPAHADPLRSDPGHSSDPTVARVAEVTLRMVAGAVPAATVRELERIRDEATASYPWERVVDRVLRDPVEKHELVRRGLAAQRDWVARGGRFTPKRSLTGRARTAGRRLLASLLVKLFVFLLYTLAVVVLLLLLKARWEWFDIYRALEWAPELVERIRSAR